ncbi:hypothetical protein LV779_33780 [Streptomyces thinghirensis]|nr:hypothetical protein [Streptomyces thinghirensis]
MAVGLQRAAAAPAAADLPDLHRGPAADLDRRWLFCVANWVGQDYFSPQSVAFLLHLGVIAVVLRRYGRSGGRGGRQEQAV